jgi:hypothetical protein
MASIIKIKRSSTQGSVPSGLAVGEIAVNLFDRKLYVGNTVGTTAIGGEDFRLTTVDSDAGAYLKLIGDSVLSTNSVLIEAGQDIDIARQANGTILVSLEDTIDANTTGTAATADQLTTARNIALSGDVSGTASFDGSQNINITTTVADDSHNHIISNVDGLQTALDSKATWTALTGTNTAIRALVSDRMQVANTRSLVNARLGSTASITLTGDVTGSGSFSSNAVSIALTIPNDTVALGTQTTGNYVATVQGTTNEIEVSGTGEGAAVTIGLPDSVTITSNLTVGNDVQIDGDLTVTGNTITVGTTNLSVSNNFIYLNDGGGNTNIDMGWAGGYNNGAYAHAGVFRDATDGRFKFFDQYAPEISDAVDIDTSHATFALSQVQANTFIGDLTGTAELANTAVKLQTARNIAITGDVSGNANFDGTGNITITADINKTGTPTGTFGSATQVPVLTIAADGRITGVSNASISGVSDFEYFSGNNTFRITTTGGNELDATIDELENYATIANVQSLFNSLSANTLSTGNATVLFADKMSVANTRTLVDARLGATASVTLTGDVTGTASFSGNSVSIATTYTNDVVLGTDTSGNYIATIQGTTNEIEVTGSGSESSAVTIGLPDDVTITGQLNVSENAVISGNTSIGGDLTVDGDLTVEGAVTYISTSTVQADDSMLKLAANNVGDVIDVGIYGKYVVSGNSAVQYAGYFRDATDGIFKFYDGLDVEPTATVDTTDTGYGLAQVDAIIDGGTY